MHGQNHIISDQHVFESESLEIKLYFVNKKVEIKCNAQFHNHRFLSQNIVILFNIVTRKFRNV